MMYWRESSTPTSSNMYVKHATSLTINNLGQTKNFFSYLVSLPFTVGSIGSYNMDRLEQDRAFFKLALETERDQFRRNILLAQLRDVDIEILRLLRQERVQAERENQNLQEALDKAMKMKKK
jgi:hypothetical protein